MTVTNGKPGLLDNLIPFRGDTFGPQLAGWAARRARASSSSATAISPA